MTLEGANVREIDYGDLSKEDADACHRVLQRAMDVHVEREHIRHGLWKKYTALDQARQAKIKIERVVQALEYAIREGTPLPTVDLLEEVPDIINYSIFTARILKGEI